MAYRLPRIAPVARAASTRARSAVKNVPSLVQHTATIALQGPPPSLDDRARSMAQADIGALIAGIPSVESIQAPYTQRGTQIDQATANLLAQLKGEQTYRVNLATGLPEAQQASEQAAQQQANQAAAALGGSANTVAPATSTLASFGTSAANQVVQQEAAAPLAGMQYHSQLDKQLLEALNQRTLDVGKANAQLPSLTNQYLNQLQQQKQAADQLAFQERTVQQNYDLATGKATNDAAYKAASLASQNARSAASIRAQNQRAASSQQNAWKIAQARIVASKSSAGATQSAATTRANRSSLAAAERYIDQNLQSRYKPTTGTGGGVSGYTVSWTGAGDPTNPGKQTPGGSKLVKPEQWQAYVATGKKDATLLGLKPGSIVGTATKITKTGTPSKPATNPDIAVGWAKGYLSRQNAAYGWGLDQATITRMAQQSVRDSGLWPNYGTKARPAQRRSSAPGRG